MTAVRRKEGGGEEEKERNHGFGRISLSARFQITVSTPKLFWPDPEGDSERAVSVGGQ